jgi:diadenosine tetraphosphate (Ap4A) HIT family hydrolase
MNSLLTLIFGSASLSPINRSLTIISGNKDESVVLGIPRTQLLKNSVQVRVPTKAFNTWSEQDHADSYSLMHAIAGVWQKTKTDQYLVYGKIDTENFHWELVPYQKCYTYFGRVIQQIQVLWNVVFGGVAISKDESRNQVKAYSQKLEQLPIIQASEISVPSHDPFCQQATIERQWVIRENKVDVLFNYAPIGLGGERLHFLIVPKAHRATFSDVTQQEYLESIALTKRLVTHFTDSRKIKTVYLLHKTGVDAGQSVPHWHLHVVFSTNKAQDFWSKLTVFKNILLGSSPMNKNELATRVKALRLELAQ